MIRTKPILPLFTIIIFLSCNSNNSSNSISNRNTFINASNAYSDFFFDSSLLVVYIAEHKLSDSISHRMTGFYNTRNYQFAWFSSAGVTEQARSFWNMYKYYHNDEPEKLGKKKTLLKEMDRLVADNDINWTGRENKLIKTELALTEQFLRFYLSHTDKDYMKRKDIEQFVPYVKNNAVKMADSIVNKKYTDDKSYEDINPYYGNLKKQLVQYLTINQKGGWTIINAKAGSLKPGSKGPPVAMLKKRLQVSGDMPGAENTMIWTEALKAGIENFQYRHGYTADGKLTPAQLKDLNVPVQNRIAQLLVNMNRTQWMIQQPKGKLIKVNLPEFILHVTEKDKQIFDMAVVVGKEGSSTTNFTGNLNQVVFAPYWNIPESIIQKEIMPAIETDPEYLADHNMEINGTLGDGVPSIRQLPGNQNSLGKVKFLFPNSFDIYFHDTPAKSLFAKDKRAYSHGCIRLSDPKKMAAYLLKDDPSWTSERIDEAMNATEEKTVRLKHPVPVFITYNTAWVDEAGKLHFAEDIYGHDVKMYQHMFR
jgi:murein L,D-transpeptidase YcbB/YkuD